MKALTVWQPWASLIITGAKPYEFRTWPAPKSLVGQRIVIHAGSRPMRRAEVFELYDRLRFDGGFGTALRLGPACELLARIVGGPGPAVPLGAGIGTAILGEPVRAAELFGSADDDIWAWPMESPEPFEPWVPMRGAQGFWEWPG